jgi:hypothetical protein
MNDGILGICLLFILIALFLHAHDDLKHGGNDEGSV